LCSSVIALVPERKGPMAVLTRLKELDQRVNDGLEITLWYDEAQDEILLQVNDGTDNTYSIVPKDKALEAFHHPYCWSVI